MVVKSESPHNMVRIVKLCIFLSKKCAKNSPNNNHVFMNHQYIYSINKFLFINIIKLIFYNLSNKF